MRKSQALTTPAFLAIIGLWLNFHALPSVASAETSSTSPTPSLYWSFDDEQNLGKEAITGSVLTANDSSHVTYFPGRSGGVVYFDGDGYLKDDTGVPTARLPISNSDYTIAAWINPTALGDRGIVGWGQYGTPTSVNAFRLYSSSALVNYWWDVDIATGNNTIVINRWQHVAVTYDGEYRSIYVDGALKKKESTNGVENDAKPLNFAIGATNNFTERFKGYLDNIAIYNTALTSIQINEAMAPRKGLGWWRNLSSVGELATSARIQLGGWNVDSSTKTAAVFAATDCRRSTQALNCLAGHLLATKLNLASGSNARCITPTVSDANTQLIAANYAGPQNYPPVSSRSNALLLKDYLEAYNNASDSSCISAALNASNLGDCSAGAPPEGGFGTVSLRRLANNSVSVTIQINTGQPNQKYTVNWSCRGQIGEVSTDESGRGFASFTAPDIVNGQDLRNIETVVVDVHLSAWPYGDKARATAISLPRLP